MWLSVVHIQTRALEYIYTITHYRHFTHLVSHHIFFSPSSSCNSFCVHFLTSDESITSWPTKVLRLKTISHSSYYLLYTRGTWTIRWSTNAQRLPQTVITHTSNYILIVTNPAVSDGVQTSAPRHYPSCWRESWLSEHLRTPLQSTPSKRVGYSQTEDWSRHIRLIYVVFWLVV